MSPMNYGAGLRVSGMIAPMVLGGASPAAAAVSRHGAHERRGDSRYAFWVENFLSIDIRSTGRAPA